jgi:predicted secreted protein
VAQFAGKDGALKIGANTVAEIDDWSLDINLDNADITKFGDQWKVKLTTLKSWSGKAKGRFDQTDTNGQAALQSALLGGTTVAIKFFANATANYNGTAFCKAIHPKATVGGVVEVDFDLEGTGALTYTP